MTENKESKCGYIAILGRPNVGKSTLLNRLIGKKISITSDKPQTTRHQILGVKTDGDFQAVYVDTPGVHKKTSTKLHKFMNKTAVSILQDVDIVLFMVDYRAFNEDDEWILECLKTNGAPVVLVINKIDLLKDKSLLLPVIDKLSKLMEFNKIFPVSVIKGYNINELEQYIFKMLPARQHFFTSDQLTNRDDRFRISEIIREKIIRFTGQEVPYGAAVTIESFEKKEKIIHIDSVIWVERPGQKIIIIGKKGEKLKQIGSNARVDIEELLGSKVFLTLWIKVKPKWSDDSNLLGQLGY